MKKYIPFIIILITTLLTQFWVIGKGNFFFQDDFLHLYNTWHLQYKEIFTIIPTQMYNDRPVGLILLKFLQNIFDYNFILYHCFFLLMHIINSFLVYIFSKRVIKKLNIKSSQLLPLFIALLFSSYPRSTFTIQWIAAVFDTLGCFLSLIYLLLATTKNKTFIRRIITFVVFYLCLRTKEATLGLPFIVLFYDYIIEQRKKIFQIINPEIILSFIYFAYLLFLKFSTNNQGFPPDNPYYLSLNPIQMFYSLIKYIYFYFALNEVGFSFTSFKILGLILLFVSSLMIIFGIIKSSSNRSYLKLYIFSILSFFMTMLPIIPMTNRQHKLYLYIPSIFLSIIIIVSVYYLSNYIFKIPSKIFFVLLLLGLFSINYLSPFQKSEINWWKNVSKRNTFAFNNLKNIPQRERYQIYNIDDYGTNILLYGPGSVLNRWFKDPKITTELFTQKYSSDKNTNACILDYNQGDYKTIDCP